MTLPRGEGERDPIETSSSARPLGGGERVSERGVLERPRSDIAFNYDDRAEEMSVADIEVKVSGGTVEIMAIIIVLIKEARARATNEVITDALGLTRFLLVRGSN